MVKRNKAFTLVEIAVVLVIIGVLSGGVLTGLKLLKNAKLSSTIMQVSNYTSAVNAFYKTYGALPGDMDDAESRIPNCKSDGDFLGCALETSGGKSDSEWKCTGGSSDERCTYCTYDELSALGAGEVCTDFCVYLWGSVYFNSYMASVCKDPTSPSYAAVSANIYDSSDIGSLFYEKEGEALETYGQVEDGVVGKIQWDMITPQHYEIFEIDDDSVGMNETILGTKIEKANAVPAETVLFWYELAQAGLIGGVTDEGLRSDTMIHKFGKTLPANKLGGGFWAAYSDGLYGIYDSSSGVTTLNNEKVYLREIDSGPYTLNGNILVLTKYPYGSKVKEFKALSMSANVKKYRFGLAASGGNAIMTPQMAAEFDRKLDDGFPHTGSVQAYTAARESEAIDNCFEDDGNDGYMYDETSSEYYCGVFVKIAE